MFRGQDSTQDTFLIYCFFSDFVSRCFPDVATDRNFIGRVSRNFLRDRDSNWRRHRQDCLELISQPPSRRFIVPVDSQKMQNKSAKKTYLPP